MLHYAMIAFQGTELCAVESDVHYTPNMAQSLRLMSLALRKRQKICYVTKRDYGWFKEDSLQDTVAHIKDQKIGIINLIRDPRDVLVSSHVGAETHDSYYVTPKRWQMSVRAGEHIVESVKDIVPAMTLRYEDVIRDADATEHRIARTFGLVKRPNMRSLSNLRDNVEAMKLPAEDWMTKAMHKLRNFDDRSISGWLNDGTKKDYVDSLQNSDDLFGDTLRNFIQQHGYQ